MPPDLARIALDAAPDAIIILDSCGAIRFANRQVAALFGYGHDEIIGARIEVLLPERFRAIHVGHREHYAADGRVRPMGAGLTLHGRRRDGGEFPVEISLSPIEHESGVLVAVAIRDVTDRKRVEAELIETRKAAEAAREIAVQARETADRANQGKSRFLATASHDLRQPLQTLELLNGALRRRITDRSAVEALSQQEQAIGAMSGLLNALLDIGKLESGTVRPEPSDFAVSAIFEEMRMEFAGIAASKGLQLEIDPCHDAVCSDRSLVEQILRNLMSNAVKYTREGFIRLRCLHEAALVRIEVLDTGVGISADQLPLIFDEFYQVGVPANSSREGYGLGLSIVQRLVKLLTLKLEVSSQPGQGTVFSLVLPASVRMQASGQAPRPTIDDALPIGEARVLLVEDNASVRNATTLLLELEGFSDYHLNDGETGTQVIATLREVLGVPLKAVLTTGDTSSAIQQLPRDPHLKITSKPIKADALLALLRSLLAA